MEGISVVFIARRIPPTPVHELKDAEISPELGRGFPHVINISEMVRFLPREVHGLTRSDVTYI